MKTKLINIVMFVLCLGFLTWLTACGGSGDKVTATDPVCGNAVVEEGEECDMGVNGDASCSVSCTLTSITAVCGNSLVETGEACEDGNAVDGDGCSSTCQFESSGSTAVIDADSDGYTSAIDCNDADAAINQGAAEVPMDGIDQDCSGVDQLLLTRTDLYSDSTGALVQTITITFDASVSTWSFWPFFDLLGDEWVTLMGAPRIQTMSKVLADGSVNETWTFAYDDGGSVASLIVTDNLAVASQTYMFTNAYNDDGTLATSSIDDVSDATYAEDYSVEFSYNGGTLSRVEKDRHYSPFGVFGTASDHNYRDIYLATTDIQVLSYSLSAFWVTTVSADEFELAYDDFNRLAQVVEDGGDTFVLSRDSSTGLLSGMTVVDSSGVTTANVMSVSTYNE